MNVTWSAVAPPCWSYINTISLVYNYKSRWWWWWSNRSRRSCLWVHEDFTKYMKICKHWWQKLTVWEFQECKADVGYATIIEINYSEEQMKLIKLSFYNYCELYKLSLLNRQPSSNDFAKQNGHRPQTSTQKRNLQITATNERIEVTNPSNCISPSWMQIWSSPRSVAWRYIINFEIRWWRCNRSESFRFNLAK